MSQTSGRPFATSARCITRLAKGFVVDTRLDGEARIVTFANGIVARELIVDIDEAAGSFGASSAGE